ncbi:MAG: YdcF family protein [Flaviaesturariibacter sp.]|nr:YdcF family protein [Flaviaesturariibacter sp.]
MFVLLKLLLFLFRPLIWIILLFLISLFTKRDRRKRIFFRAAVIALLFFSNPFIITQLIRAYEPEPLVLPTNAVYPAGIMLGGFVGYNLKDDKGYFNPASDRFIQTALLYKAGHIKKVIVAAGNGYIVKHEFKEAVFIKQHLMQLGIPEGDIYTDTKSKNTLQNAINAKKVADSLQMKGPFLLISSALHLPRAKQVFVKQGLAVTLYPCNFISKQVGNTLLEDGLLPSAEALRNWDLYIKELLGSLAYKLTGNG